MFELNLKILSQVVPEKSLTENFVREKEKWTNEGTDNQYVAESQIHSTTSLPSFVPNFRILSQVVPEKSFTEKSLHTQTYFRKKQKLYTPYILRMPGV